jgi:hypothetical protein
LPEPRQLRARTRAGSKTGRSLEARSAASVAADGGLGRHREGNPTAKLEALHKTILDECWRPSFARYLCPRLRGSRRELEHYLAYYNHDRVHHGRLTHGCIPADIVPRCPQDKGEMSRKCRHISEAVHTRIRTRKACPT